MTIQVSQISPRLSNHKKRRASRGGNTKRANKEKTSMLNIILNNFGEPVKQPSAAPFSVLNNPICKESGSAFQPLPAPRRL